MGRLLQSSLDNFIPGQIITKSGDIEINSKLAPREITVKVANTGDRPIQIGSHFHFYEVCNALDFNRDKALGYRLNIASGTATRFEPGQSRVVHLIPYQGNREVYGFTGKIMGKLNK